MMREHWKCAEFSGKDSPHEEILWETQVFFAPVTRCMDRVWALALPWATKVFVDFTKPFV